MSGAYKRNFVTLKQERNDYSMNGKQTLGRCIIETKFGKCKISVHVQDLKPQTIYKVYLIASEPNESLGVSCGTIHVDAKGKGDLKCEFDANNVFTSKKTIEDFQVVSVIVPKKNDLVAVMTGFIQDEVMWKNRFVDFEDKIKTEQESIQVEPEIQIEEAPTEAEPESHIEEAPTEAEPKIQIEEAPTEVEPETQIEEAPTEVKPEIQIEEAPTEVKPEIQIEEAPTEVEPKIQIKEAPTEVEPEIQIEEAPTEAEPESQIEEAPTEVESEIHIEETPTEAEPETQTEEFPTEAELNVQIKEASTEVQPETQAEEAIEEKKPESKFNFTEAEEIRTEEIHSNRTEGTAESNFKKIIQEYDEIMKNLQKSGWMEREQKPKSSNVAYVFENYAELFPFEREEKEIRWVRITLKDLLLLDMDSCSYMNHPFVTASYHRYKHLLLGEHKKEGTKHYTLGIPDFYSVEYKAIAAELGFTQFRYCHSDEFYARDYGYWLKEV